jgi:hypothetical protein
MSMAYSAQVRAEQTLRMPQPTPKVPRRPNVKESGFGVPRIGVSLSLSDFEAQPTVCAPHQLMRRSSLRRLEGGGIPLLVPREEDLQSNQFPTDKERQ